MQRKNATAGQTNPVIKVRTPGEMLEMVSMLKRFEDDFLEQILQLPEGPARATKEKRLSIARGVRAGIEWALGIGGKELDHDLIGLEWETWRRFHKSQ